MTEAKVRWGQVLTERGDSGEVIPDLSLNLLVSIVQTQWRVSQEGSLQTLPPADQPPEVQ